MKSYKDTTRSYKDLDKEIILNAPEGAMWVYGELFYKYENELLVFLNNFWEESSIPFWATTMGMSCLDCQQDEDFIPLPNIEIPWEATADSECPVPDGFEIMFLISNDWVYNSVHLNSELCWRGCSSGITAYKIIDREYLYKAKPTQEEPIHIPEKPTQITDFGAIRDYQLELQQLYESTTPERRLTKRLKFLQNLADQFPEIYDEIVAEMKIQFECYCEEHL